MKRLEDKIDIYYKQCLAIAPLAIAKEVGVAYMFLSPFISQIINKVKSADNIKSSLEEVIKKLEDYKNEYTFDKYSTQIEEFLKNCKSLLSIYSNINSNEDINLVKSFIETSYKIEMSGQSTKAYIDDLKNFGGKTFDMVKNFGMNLGFDTKSTAVSESIDVLYKQLAIERPKFEMMYKDLANKIDEAELNKNDNVIKTEFDDFANISF